MADLLRTCMRWVIVPRYRVTLCQRPLRLVTNTAGGCRQLRLLQVANQQGAFLAKLLSGKITDPTKQSFKYKHFGEFTPVMGIS